MTITRCKNRRLGIVGSLGQVDIISALLIVVIGISLVSAALLWGLPLIQKNQSRAIINRVANDFDRTNTNSLPKKIEEIANSDEGSFTTFTISTDGLWVLDPYDPADPESNSIYFIFNAKESDIAAGLGWIPNTCGGSAGLVGTDAPIVVCKRADAIGSDNYNITYKLWFRERAENFEDPDAKIYKLGLVQHTSSLPRSTGKSIRIFRGPITTDEVNKNLIITEIKILLE